MLLTPFSSLLVWAVWGLPHWNLWIICFLKYRVLGGASGQICVCLHTHVFFFLFFVHYVASLLSHHYILWPVFCVYVSFFFTPPMECWIIFPHYSFSVLRFFFFCVGLPFTLLGYSQIGTFVLDKLGEQKHLDFFCSLPGFLRGLSMLVGCIMWFLSCIPSHFNR